MNDNEDLELILSLDLFSFAVNGLVEIIGFVGLSFEIVPIASVFGGASAPLDMERDGDAGFGGLGGVWRANDWDFEANGWGFNGLP